MSNLSPELLDIARRTAETMEQFSKTLISLNDEPNPQPATAPAVTQGIGDGLHAPVQPTRRMMSGREMFDLKSALHEKSTQELLFLFSEQARRKDTGIPVDMWLSRGGQALNDAYAGPGGGVYGQLDPEYQRALDTGGAAALIRQDLEPILYELYIRQFPAWERFRKEPANGLTHTFQQITSYGAASFMGELGTVVDDKSTYVRQTTNVAIVATRRGISLKSQYAITAGGMAWNAEQLELQGGLRSISKKMQDTLFGGNGTDSGGTADNEMGLFDANGFTGIRYPLSTSRAKNIDPATNPDTDGYIRRAVDQAVVEITQAGGPVPSIAWINPWDMETFNEQQDSKTRIVVPNQVSIGVGVTAREVNTIAGPVPFGLVPGDSIGSYHSTNYSNNKVRDIYLLDESTISMPFLGSEGPTVLDIPIGISGQLTHMFIIFGMWGLAVKAPQFSNKIRVKVP